MLFRWADGHIARIDPDVDYKERRRNKCSSYLPYYCELGRASCYSSWFLDHSLISLLRFTSISGITLAVFIAPHVIDIRHDANNGVELAGVSTPLYIE